MISSIPYYIRTIVSCLHEKHIFYYIVLLLLYKFLMKWIWNHFSSFNFRIHTVLLSNPNKVGTFFDLWIKNLSKRLNTEITAVIWRKKPQNINHDQQQSPPPSETEGHGRRRPFSGRKRKSQRIQKQHQTHVLVVLSLGWWLPLGTAWSSLFTS